jgi:trigger factor
LEVTINTVSDVQREAEFALTNDELLPHFEGAYKKFAPKAEIKGFRKGKVPMGMIKKMYGEAIEQDALDEIANASFRSAMVERNIEPIGPPKMTTMDFKRGEHFKFKIEYEVKPTIELKDYKGLRVEKPVHTVTESEVTAEIDRLRHANATMLGVTLVRDNDDHVITADVQELAEDGMPLIGKKTKDGRFYLSDATLAQEIKETLSKAEVGTEYKVRFEQHHSDHAHKHHIAISVKKIEKVELPVFDDAFVKKITQDKIQTKDAFLANLRNDLSAYWEQQSERKVQDNIVDTIVKSHDFAVPDTLVNLYLDSFVEDVKNRTRDKKLPAGFDTVKFRAENKEFAMYQAKWGLLRDQILEQEHLTVTDEEIEKLVESEAPSLGIEKEMLLKYYKSGGGVTERLLSNKLMKLLKDTAVVTEKSADDAA